MRRQGLVPEGTKRLVGYTRVKTHSAHDANARSFPKSQAYAEIEMS